MPRAYQYRPVILDYMRPQQSKQSSTTAEIRKYANAIVLKAGLTERPHAFNFALTCLVKERLIERPKHKQGHYHILPAGLEPFTETDGERLTDKYEHRKRPT